LVEFKNERKKTFQKMKQTINKQSAVFLSFLAVRSSQELLIRRGWGQPQCRWLAKVRLELNASSLLAELQPASWPKHSASRKTKQYEVALAGRTHTSQLAFFLINELEALSTH